MMNHELAVPEDPQLAHLVRSTLIAATQPESGQMRRLMPPPPEPVRARGFVPTAYTWQKQWVAVMACVSILLGSLGFYWAQSGSRSVTPLPTSLAVTATMTNEPTMTVAANSAVPLVPPLRKVSTRPAASTGLTIAPSPNPTPVAALLPQVTSN